MTFEGEFVKGGKTIHWWDAPMRKLANDVDNMAGVEVMVEVRDARIPRTSTHELFAKWRSHFRCHYIVLFTHEDAITDAQEKEIREWTIQSLRVPAKNVFFEDLRGHKDRFQSEFSHVTSRIRDLCLLGGDPPRGQAKKALIVGIPNVGKSSFVYIVTKEMTKKKKRKGMYHAPKVRDFAGETQNIKSHWLFEKPTIMLTDSPGIFPPAWQLEADPEAVYKLAVCGGINLSDVASTPVGLQHREVIEFLLYKLNKAGLHKYVEYFKLDGPTESADILLQAVTQASGNSEKQRCLAILSAFNSGYLGPLILDDLSEIDNSHAQIAEKEERKRSDLSRIGIYDDNFLEDKGAPRDRGAKHPLDMAWPGAELDHELARQAGIRNPLSGRLYQNSLPPSGELPEASAGSHIRNPYSSRFNGLRRNSEPEEVFEIDTEGVGGFDSEVDLEPKEERRPYARGYHWESNRMGSYERNARPGPQRDSDRPYQVSQGSRRDPRSQEPWEYTMTSPRRSSRQPRPLGRNGYNSRSERDGLGGPGSHSRGMEYRGRLPRDGYPDRGDGRQRDSSPYRSREPPPSPFEDEMEFHFDDFDY